MTSGLRRALLAIGVAGLACTVAIAVVVLESNHESNKTVTVVFGAVIGLGFIGTGLFAWWRRPENRVGALMTAVGFVWYLGALSESNNATLFTIGIALNAVTWAVVVHMLLAFPSGRIEGRGPRVILGLTWVAVIVIPLGHVLFTEDYGLKGSQPDDVLLIEQNQGIADAINAVGNVIALGVAAALTVVLVRRWRTGTRVQRRSYAPVYVTGAVLAAGLALGAVLDLAGTSQDVQDVFFLIPFAAFGAMPFAFLVGLGRSRYSRAGALKQIVTGLSETASLRESLAAALADPTLRVLYRRPGRDEYVYADGARAELPAGATMVERDGEVVGALVHDPVLAEEPDLLAAAGTAAAVAMENERLDAELRARVAELQDARERYLRGGLEERRRLERDLHDGAQQRLVALSLQLGLARSRIASDPAAAGELLDTARAELTQALEELRELARGIHPAILTDRGLDAALEALADRAPVRVAVEETPEDRLPGAVEAAAYFVVAESLTNVAKYARAGEAHVSVSRHNGSAVVEVRDDGVGGADARQGTGLRGLADRLSVLDGRLEVHSPPGEGTLVRATIPCASS
jgi:signal transduction histidine kinase